jgi:hypothetical protein
LRLRGFFKASEVTDRATLSILYLRAKVVYSKLMIVGGHSLEQIHLYTGVELEVLKQFLPVVAILTQIDADQRPYDIILGVSERAVLAYTLGSECKTHNR